jgi:hypothetical protein
VLLCFDDLSMRFGSRLPKPFNSPA